MKRRQRSSESLKIGFQMTFYINSKNIPSFPRRRESRPVRTGTYRAKRFLQLYVLNSRLRGNDGIWWYAGFKVKYVCYTFLISACSIFTLTLPSALFGFDSQLIQFKTFLILVKKVVWNFQTTSNIFGNWNEKTTCRYFWVGRAEGFCAWFCRFFLSFSSAAFLAFSGISW